MTTLMPRFVDITTTGDNPLSSLMSGWFAPGTNTLGAIRAWQSLDSGFVVPTGANGVASPYVYNHVFFCHVGYGAGVAYATTGGLTPTWAWSGFSGVPDCRGLELTSGGAIIAPWSTTTANSGAFVAGRFNVSLFRRSTRDVIRPAAPGLPAITAPAGAFPTEFRGVAWAPVPLLCEPGFFCAVAANGPLAAAPCPAGSYCPFGATTPVTCPPY